VIMGRRALRWLGLWCPVVGVKEVLPRRLRPASHPFRPGSEARSGRGLNWAGSPAGEGARAGGQILSRPSAGEPREILLRPSPPLPGLDFEPLTRSLRTGGCGGSDAGWGKWGTQRKPAPEGADFLRWYVRRCPTLPRGLPRSTIGAEGLNFRVRDGTGCFPLAMAAATLWRYQPGSRPYSGNRTVNASAKVW
jgi:hypothetical protein